MLKITVMWSFWCFQKLLQSLRNSKENIEKIRHVNPSVSIQPRWIFIYYYCISFVTRFTRGIKSTCDKQNWAEALLCCASKEALGCFTMCSPSSVSWHQYSRTALCFVLIIHQSAARAIWITAASSANSTWASLSTVVWLMLEDCLLSTLGPTP